MIKPGIIADAGAHRQRVCDGARIAITAGQANLPFSGRNCIRVYSITLQNCRLATDNSMNELLKGNFPTKNAVQDKPQELSLEDQFEKAALKRLGGSINFVSKKKVTWNLDSRPDSKADEK
jgi:hypothetical protein